MLLLKRPPRPADFETKIAEYKIKAEQEIQRFVSEKAAGVPKPKKPEFPPAWSGYKSSFAEAQHDKCGYCEVRVIAGFNGDVEHFRPKGELWKLPDNPDEWGRQRPHSASVEERRHELLDETGYWWLAYEWDNWLLSCQACNSSWKSAFFPVAGVNRTLPPDPQITEQPLLINPFDGPDPAEHLRFGDLGEVEALNGSQIGQETIKICGLDRRALQEARLEKIRGTFNLIQDLLQAETSQEVDKVLLRFYDYGKEEYDYAGVVRSIIRQECELNWEVIEEAVKLMSVPN